MVRSLKIKELVVPPGYVVPPPRLNWFHPEFEPVPHKDEVFRIPLDWLRANISRYYFTDQQLLDAAVPEFDDSMADKYAPCSGIYFLILDKQIVYVGLANDIGSRLIQHDRAGRKYDSLTWLEAPKLFMEHIETYYIYRIKPPLNLKYPPVCDGMLYLQEYEQQHNERKGED